MDAPRHRAGLVRLRTQLQDLIHAVVADVDGSCLSGPLRGWLAGLELPAVSLEIVTDAPAVIDGLALLTGRIDGDLRQHAKADRRVTVLTTLPGVGGLVVNFSRGQLRLPVAMATVTRLTKQPRWGLGLDTGD